MKKIGEATHDIVANNPLLHFGFYHRLLNLSQTARFIQPLVEARTKKSVRASAVLMNLSRLQAKLVAPERFDDLVIDKISIHSGLCSLTVFKTSRVNEELNRLFTLIRRRGGFITVTESVDEVTAILEDRDFAEATNILSETPRYIYRDIASVGIRLSDENIVTPGVIYRLLQQVSLQGINVMEVASTATEFIIYVNEADVRLAFDSIYHRFSKRTGGTSDI